MLTTQCRLAKRNHDPVRLVGDLYFVEDIKKSSNGLKPVAVIKKAFNQRYAKSIPVDIDCLEQLSEGELKSFHTEAKRIGVES